MAKSNAKDSLFASYDAEYWNTYLDARPTYSPDFYNLIFDHHRHKGNNSWTLAHDVGTGPGNVAAVLAERFAQVIATDTSPDNVNAARQRQLQTNKIRFAECNGEDLARAALSPPRTADLVANAEAIPLMDAEEAIGCFAELLAPGGTGAVWFYGRPTFAGPDTAVNEACQRIFYRISTRLLNKIGGMSGPLWERSTRTIASQLDNVAFPAEQWRHVVRYKWNCEQTCMLFHDESQFGGPVERVNCVGPGEEVVSKTDPGFWQMQWGAAEVRRWFEANLPTWFEDKAQDLELESCYEQLDRVMGSESLPVAWPVVLLLATRV